MIQTHRAEPRGIEDLLLIRNLAFPKAVGVAGGGVYMLGFVNPTCILVSYGVIPCFEQGC